MLVWYIVRTLRSSLTALSFTYVLLSHLLSHTCMYNAHSCSLSNPLSLSLTLSLTQRFTDPKHHSPACTTYYKEHNSTFSQARMGSERAPFGQAALRFRRNRRDKEIPGSVTHTVCSVCVSVAGKLCVNACSNATASTYIKLKE